MDSFFQVIESPLFAVCLCLLLGAIAVSGKFSQFAANILLTGLWIVGSLSLMRIPDKRLMIGGILMLAGFCFIVSHWVRPGGDNSPQSSSSTQPVVVEPPATVSAVSFSPAFIDFLNNLSVIQAGKKLGFRFYFKNNGPITANDVRIINVSSLVKQLPDPPTEAQMLGALRGVADAQRKQKHMLGPTVDLGATTTIDVTNDALDWAQAKALVAGTGRLYEYFWIHWTDVDGKTGEQEIAMWLPKPKSKRLTGEDIKAWAPVNLPPLPPKQP
jgi:hypothetical protein